MEPPAVVTLCSPYSTSNEAMHSVPFIIWKLWVGGRQSADRLVFLSFFEPLGMFTVWGQILTRVGTSLCTEPPCRLNGDILSSLLSLSVVCCYLEMMCFSTRLFSCCADGFMRFLPAAHLWEDECYKHFFSQTKCFRRFCCITPKGVRFLEVHLAMSVFHRSCSEFKHKWS